MNKNTFINDLPQLMKKLVAGQVILTSKVLDRFAGMTIAWGFFGNMWNQLYFTAAVRPSRHTFSIMRLSHSFTVNFFDHGYEKELHYFGSMSGHQEDKFCNDALHIDIPLLDQFTAPIVEAKYAIECKVKDTHPINAYQIQTQTDTLKFYPQNNDYHIMVYGKIEEIVKRV
jgi:flavin reductase (DIM6/NTAB) family NADH-FMN oxidoreductase RutF